ncbi:MAG: FeoB-associated Cys-rich membrane protein [Ruminococcus sp.]
MGTILVGIIVIALIIGAIYGIYRQKKNGESFCGGDCKHCGGSCHRS